jgi:DNA-binding transcriptional LysR family regulator
MTLFKRSSRGVTPTLYGDVIIRHAKLILAQIRHASEELTSLNQGITGHITVGTLLAASPILIPKSLLILKKERPNISVSVIEGTNDKLMPALRVGELDLVIGRLPEFREREGLKQYLLYGEPISIVARKGHPLADKDNLSLEYLRDFEWILPLQQTTLRRQIESEFRDAGLEPPKNTIESISILTNYKLLVETDMIAAMPYQVVENYPQLIRLPIIFKAAISQIGISVRSQTALSPAVCFYIDTLKKVVEQFNTKPK